MSDLEKLQRQLVRHEDLKLKPYKDTVGKLTIGVGRNLDDKGINQFEAMTMLSRDIREAEEDLKRTFSWYSILDDVRQNVLLNMCFNMGIDRLKGFKNTIENIKIKNYVLASKQMLDSLWARQVGLRAIELAKMMETGQWPVQES